MNDKVMPKNIEAEQKVLTSIFADNKKLNKAMDILSYKDFYDIRHQLIFKKMIELMSNNDIIDHITISEAIGEDNIKSAGGLSYIYELYNSGLKTEGTQTYAKIVKEKSIIRGFIRKATNILEMSYSSDYDIDDILNEFQNVEIEKSNKQKILTDGELFFNTISSIEKRMKNGGELSGIITGLYNIDCMTKGFERGDLVVLGGRPSMGKTMLSLIMMENMKSNGFKSLFFEHEMSDSKIGTRRLANICNIDTNKIKMGMLNDEEWKKLSIESNKAQAENMIFTDVSTRLTVEEIKGRAKRIKQKHGLDVIFIDHLGKMKLPKKETQTLSIAEVTSTLKDIAKELDVVVIVLSQLNRGVESRTDKRPMLSDLRDSGSIEQDADIVMFVYREEYYNKDTSDKNIMEIIFAKQRDGEVGTKKMKYNFKNQSISDFFE